MAPWPGSNRLVDYDEYNELQRQVNELRDDYDKQVRYKDQLAVVISNLTRWLSEMDLLQTYLEWRDQNAIQTGNSNIMSNNSGFPGEDPLESLDRRSDPSMLD